MHPAAVRERARALAAAGRSDAEIAAQIHLPRTTVRDIRRTATRPVCPRCWRQAQPMNWGYDDYAFLLGLYLGDGYISRGDRTFRLRLSLDARHPGVIADARRMLERGFCRNRVGLVVADGGSTIVVSVYSSHLPCLLPQHASGVKHRRTIELETWQVAAVRAAPFQFIRGCIWSDGCMFINRTGPYAYLTADFCNFSADIRHLFAWACEEAGIDYRANGDRVPINKRESVSRLVKAIGTKH